ncbi:hypothetical protein EYZ11_012553 [Aspergillus tanneri]|uniref:Transcription factor domain-containing protein n=1 Tax=Aspergillus tanneri TaxID=1220188 RepID=A0A4S3J5C6_9EURO|nr:uncharacterized protein ATNIH1004_008631 [Aspergillus tanneri]KAA8644427.1 hypothetical protein ATNIH1004_008631 [Aspergillus tanneri]THC88001.1 hypothetical protein EYZ11_012553 [Aspergillus tanneri]
MQQNETSAARAFPEMLTEQPIFSLTEIFNCDRSIWDIGTQNCWPQKIPDTEKSSTFDPPETADSEWSSTSVNAAATCNTFLTTPPFQLQFDGQGGQTDVGVTPESDSSLIEFFIQSVRPPILADIEAHKKWLTMRHAIVGMARHSPIVRSAVSAFATLLISRQNNNADTCEQNHYQNAIAGVAGFDSSAMAEYSNDREHVLVALFFLCYIDILEIRMEMAHLNLKRAYNIFQRGHKTSFSSMERQLLLWIRLLDARAVSAGGDGLFLLEDVESLLGDSSPAKSDSIPGTPDGQSVGEDDVEDVLFQALYQPGVIFYQKVQSYMGHISKLDPWHRSRGTVEDEIEVMNKGASIAAGLRSLYNQRPILMDLAVAGRLVEPHLSSSLACAITRAFRTYLLNFYACKVHLHRVAYKTLPLTKEVEDALSQIRKLAQQIVADLEPSDNPPVTILWPLLMLGAEETDESERQWIRAQLLRMENVVGNAGRTTKVLDKVQSYQDTAKVRMDIRAVMHSEFNLCFAIV